MEQARGPAAGTRLARVGGGMPRIRAFLLMLPCLALLGCDPRGEPRMSAPPPPPSAVIAPSQSSLSLPDKLRLLKRELDIALNTERHEEAAARLFRAEAITDALLESGPPFEWLDSDYAVEARLRQLQALADRVVAQLRRGVPNETLRVDVELLRQNTARLEAALRNGGGRTAPPPLDSLLRRGAVVSG